MVGAGGRRLAPMVDGKGSAETVRHSGGCNGVVLLVVLWVSALRPYRQL